MSHKSLAVHSVSSELTRLQTWVQALALTHTDCMSNHAHLGGCTLFCTTVWMGMMLVSVLQVAMRLEERTLNLCQLHTNTNQHTSLTTPPSSDCRFWPRDSEPSQSQALIPLTTAIGPGKGTWPNVSQSECLPGIFFWPKQLGSSFFLFDPEAVGRSAWRCLQLWFRDKTWWERKEVQGRESLVPVTSRAKAPLPWLRVSNVSQ